MTKDRAPSRRRTTIARSVVTAPTGPPWLNENLMSDPIGADVRQMPTVDAVPSDSSNFNGGIDGRPGRYEGQDEEDAAAGLDLTPAPLGASNG